jgi:DNA-binding transcriptional ArsR family regulator
MSIAPVLDQTFAALADPTRRGIIARLQVGDGLTVSELAKPYAMSLPAVIKHLDVLTEAGLVTRTRKGRHVVCRIRPDPMADAKAWLDRHLNFWNERLDALAVVAEDEGKRNG